MNRWIITLLIALWAGVATASSLGQRIAVENDYRRRVEGIIEKIDPSAIVVVKIDLRRVVTESLPVFGFGAESTPTGSSGELSKASIERVNVRIVTQVEEVPEWIKEEVTSAIGSDIKTEVKIEKAKGKITDQSSELAKFAMAATQSAIEGISSLKWGLWALAGALGFILTVIGFILMRFASRLEQSFSRLIEEKVVPAIQQSGGGGRAVAGAGPSESRSDKPMNIQMTGGGGAGGQKELADLPMPALVSVLVDCYWTESDAYANYLWSQMTQDQRSEVLKADVVEKRYFSYIRQFQPENMNYHFDARYLILGADFQKMDQKDLQVWLQENPKLFRRITPLRWDLLPLNLETRLSFLEMGDDEASVMPGPVKVSKASPRRHLKEKIQIKTLSPADEGYIWEHPEKVPVEARRELASLVWLALAEKSYIESVLGELDARQLAIAWVAPESVLNKLKEAIPAKKLEMLEHFLKDTRPDRNSETFKYLFQAGLQAPAPEHTTETQRAA